MRSLLLDSAERGAEPLALETTRRRKQGAASFSRCSETRSSAPTGSGDSFATAAALLCVPLHTRGLRRPEREQHTSPAAVLILQVFLCGCFWFRSGGGFARNGFEPVVHVEQKLSHDCR